MSLTGDVTAQVVRRTSGSPFLGKLQSGEAGVIASN
jgi:hypothetical protein